MLRTIISALFITGIVSCQTQTDKSALTQEQEREFMDSVKEAMAIEINQEVANTLFDTVGVSAAPVQILSSSLVKEDYSNSRDVTVTYKNVSNKKISAVRIKWYGLNAFNEPADMGSVTQAGFGGGFDDEALLPGKSKTSTWGINSRDGKKIVFVWPCEVAFADGTKWESK